MTFGEAVGSGFRRAFDYRGRSSRSEYWWFTLFYVLAIVAAVLVAGLMPMFGAVLALLILVAVIVPSLSVLVRRLHDVDRSGWWFGAQIGLGVLASGVSAAAETERGIALLGLAVAIPNLILSIAILIWLLRKGTDGPNYYGPDPLEPIRRTRRAAAASAQSPWA